MNKNTLVYAKMEDEEETQEEPSRNLYRRVKQVNEICYFLDKPIGHLSEYRDLIYCIDNLGQDDVLTLVVNSPGGFIHTACAIIDSINRTQGKIRAEVTGRCHSAATCITLSCHEIYISDYTSFMIHSATYGTIGKMHEVSHDYVFNDNYLKDFIKDSYYGFLTPEEIDNVLQGKDHWMRATEVRQRLENRNAILLKDRETQEFVDQALDSSNQETKPTKPIKPRKKKKDNSQVDEGKCVY